MNPVHAMGVCHDQNGSILASMPACEIAMTARPSHAENGRDRRVGVTPTSNRRSSIRESPICNLQLALSPLGHGDEDIAAFAPEQDERRLAGLHLLQLARDLADVGHLLTVDLEDDIARLD